VTPDDAYAVLGLSPGASQAQIKTAWRRLASRWHPDRNPDPNAVLRMQRINQAFECLQTGWDESDRPEDSPPDEPAEAPAEAASSASATSSSTQNNADARQHTSATGRNAEPIFRRIRVSLDEAALGCLRALRGRATYVCVACGGSGHEPGPGHSCPRCQGSGQLMQPTWFGWGRVAVDCTDCAGTGRLHPVCQACEGVGQWPNQAWRLRVRLPAGVRDGDVLVVPARPEQAGHPPTDVHLQVVLERHALFRLDEAHVLHCRMPVDGFAWMAGRWVEVPVPGGWQQMRLNRKHLNYRLKGQGFPLERRGERGDLLIHVDPIFPEELSAQQQELLDRLIASQAEQHAAEGGRLADWAQRMARAQTRRQRRRRAHTGSN
jgi:molecular chaperone DnaJ